MELREEVVHQILHVGVGSCRVVLVVDRKSEGLTDCVFWQSCYLQGNAIRRAKAIILISVVSWIDDSADGLSKISSLARHHWVLNFVCGECPVNFDVLGLEDRNADSIGNIIRDIVRNILRLTGESDSQLELCACGERDIAVVGRIGVYLERLHHGCSHADSRI